jgi:hypothetical protein
MDTDVAVTERKAVEVQGTMDQLKPVLGERRGQVAAKTELRSTLQTEIDQLE